MSKKATLEVEYSLQCFRAASYSYLSSQLLGMVPQRVLSEGNQFSEYNSTGMHVLRDSWPATGLSREGQDKGEHEQPRMLAEYMHQVLSFIAMNLHRVHRVPVAFQVEPVVIIYNIYSTPMPGFVICDNGIEYNLVLVMP